MTDLFFFEALKKGFEAYGAVNIEKLKKYSIVLYLRKIEDRECEIEETDIRKRTEFIDYPWAKSVIIFAYPYNLYKDTGIHNVASYALGRDYHLVIKEKLDELCEIFKEKTAGRFESFCDTNPFLERAIAVESGMGFQGKNGSIIIEGLGSAFYLGEILTDLDIEFISENEDYCGDCVKCIKVCPAKAITDNGIDAKRCLSFISQKKGELSEEEGRLLGNRLFGCDTCQLVCPYNAGIILERESKNPYEIEDLFNMSNREFREKYGGLASSWRGKKILKRNAEWNIKNLRRNYGKI